MAQINKPDLYFNTLLRNGTGSSVTAITGVGFQPDWIWQKRRDDTSDHHLTDSVRGATKLLYSSSTSAEQTNSGFVQSIDSDGFTMGANDWPTSATVVAWNWLAGGTASSNTDGSITSNVSASTTSGFSIVSWTGSGADATVGHGLNSAPTIFIVKNIADVADWRVGQVLGGNIMTGGNGYYMELNDTKASTNPGSAVTWGSTPTAPTSSVFTVGSNNAHNGSSDAMIAYCFHSVKGYSKMGSYVGNGNADGTFVYTGMKPAFLLLKRTNAASQWRMYDNKRDTDNVVNHLLYPNGGDAEAFPSTACDFLSNGIKVRDSAGDINASGGTYIYMAFAENPLVAGNYVPTTAR